VRWGWKAHPLQRVGFLFVVATRGHFLALAGIGRACEANRRHPSRRRPFRSLGMQAFFHFVTHECTYFTPARPDVADGP